MPDIAECAEKLRQLSPAYEAEAREKYIPIIRPESLKLLLDAAKKSRCSRILEIGTAIGFSTAWLATETGAVVDTIEKDEERLDRAKAFWKEVGIEERINPYLGDADELAARRIQPRKLRERRLNVRRGRRRHRLYAHGRAAADGDAADRYLFRHTFSSPRRRRVRAVCALFFPPRDGAEKEGSPFIRASVPPFLCCAGFPPSALRVRS